MGGKHKPIAEMTPSEQEAMRAYHCKKSMEWYHRNRDKALARHKAWRAAIQYVEQSQTQERKSA